MFRNLIEPTIINLFQVDSLIVIVYEPAQIQKHRFRHRLSYGLGNRIMGLINTCLINLGGA